MWTDRQTAVHCDPLRCIAETSQNASVPLRCAADHYGVLQQIAETLHVSHLQWSASHTKPPCNNSGQYGNVTESSGTTGTLDDHCDVLQCIAVHCSASSTCCGGVHHTLTEMPNSIHLPHHPANPQISQPTRSMHSTCLYPTDTTYHSTGWAT